MSWRSPEKNCLTFFFGEHLRLCPWPWSRVFLSLASGGSVLGRAVLGLGLGFFCVLGLGLEPCVFDSTFDINQRWSSRGHILKFLALASKPQVLENWPVLGWRTALFIELLKFCGALETFFGTFFPEIAWKIFVKTFFGGEIAWKKNFFCDLWRAILGFGILFFGEHLRLCPSSLALASSIPVLGLRRVCPRKGYPWPWPRNFFCVLGLGLEPCVLDSTSDINVDQAPVPPNIVFKHNKIV